MENVNAFLGGQHDSQTAATYWTTEITSFYGVFWEKNLFLDNRKQTIDEEQRKNNKCKMKHKIPIMEGEVTSEMLHGSEICHCLAERPGGLFPLVCVIAHVYSADQH